MSLGSGLYSYASSMSYAENSKKEEARLAQREKALQLKQERLDQAHERLLQNQRKLEAEEMRAYAQKVNAENRLEQTRIKEERERNKQDQSSSSIRNLEERIDYIEQHIFKLFGDVHQLSQQMRALESHTGLSESRRLQHETERASMGAPSPDQVSVLSQEYANMSLGMARQAMMPQVLSPNPVTDLSTQPIQINNWDAHVSNRKHGVRIGN